MKIDHLFAAPTTQSADNELYLFILDAADLVGREVKAYFELVTFFFGILIEKSQ